jgi:hypothetical protein
VRLLLVLTLINGLVPALGEVAEAAVHFAVEGHLAHSDADQGDLGDQGREHGCGTTAHFCECCASQLVVSAPVSEASVRPLLAPEPAAAPEALVSLHEPTPPFRPPIAS